MLPGAVKIGKMSDVIDVHLVECSEAFPTLLFRKNQFD
jgi:hypothetical protein